MDELVVVVVGLEIILVTRVMLQILLPAIVAQVGQQGRGQGIGKNPNDDAVNDTIWGDVSRGCTYKEFLACNPKEYDGKGGAIVYTHWIKKIESVHDISECRDSQKVKYTAGSFVGMVAATEQKTIQMAVKLAGTLTDEPLRNGSIKKNPEKKENGGKPSKDMNGCENQRNQARGRAFMLGAEEAHQDLNIVTGIDPSDLVFSYEIKIANGQLVEIDKVIRRCKLEIEGHVFGINLIPFGSRTFDMIIGMDWLSDHKAEIIYHEKVVKIPLLDGKVLRVLGEKPKEKGRQLLSAKTKEKKQEEIVVLRDFLEVNVVADALSRKKRVKPKRVRAMNMTLQSSIKDKILTAQKEASDESAGLQKAHKSKYSIHLGADKMYYDLRDRPPGLLQQPKILNWKWEGIAMDFVTKLPRTSSGHDTIWVIMDRLTKSAYFLPMHEDYKMDRLARLYLNEIVARHGVPISIISDHDNFEGSWDVHLPLVEFSYNNSYHSSVRCASFEALYGSKCRFPIMWAEKSYADKRRKPLEFSVGDYVLLKVSPWKGMVRFWKKGKLTPRFVGPFEIIEKVGPAAYMLDFPEELDGVHDTFHVSNLKKCLADPTLQVPLDEIKVDAKLNFVEEPVEILEREINKLKRSKIANVKVRWNLKRGNVKIK
uniref:Tf2-1-like SH3-like domain-containing protein n=1 Tax=Tanacetum cinerariifolium TaxID=118510 RepID=A0A6L2N931_TANCI|nr:hypothetical protein [Tanacetum cinerariifolium]